MNQTEIESKIRELITHAWDDEVKWHEIESWVNNFQGQFHGKNDEQLHAIYSITQYMYFGKRLVREMLKSLYREHFSSPLKQRIRRNYQGTLDFNLINAQYISELDSTRFIGVGNPSESGAHLLYYFRQVNGLSKDLFSDLSSVIQPVRDRDNNITHELSSTDVKRIVFFDDIVGSGTQASTYLSKYIRELKKNSPTLEIRFMCLFSTTQGLARLNNQNVFNGNAMCLFELDETYKCLGDKSRYFKNTPDWFDMSIMKSVLQDYGKIICPSDPLGYKDGQLMISFSHNTPDNVPPVYWHSRAESWNPVFLRYQKMYY